MQTNYRDYILEEFKKRTAKNPQYSLRAFARDLQLTPSRLSEALNRKCGISSKRASDLADLIGLPTVEKQRFVTMVEAEHGRSKAVRSKAEQALENTQPTLPEKTLQLEWIKYFSSWHHNALLELVYVDGFKPLPIWIARRLGITILEAREALNRLLYLGLLKVQDGKVFRDDEFLACPSDVPSADLRRIQTELLKKAEHSLAINTIQERDVTAVVFAVDKDKMKEAKEALKTFRRKFCRDMVSVSQNKNRVYALTMQFFPLDQETQL